MARPEPLSPARYTFDEVCKITRLSRSTIRKRMSEGLFPKPCDRARQFLFRANDIDKYLQGDVNQDEQPRFSADAFRQTLTDTRRATRELPKAEALLRPKKRLAPRLAYINPNTN